MFLSNLIPLERISTARIWVKQRAGNEIIMEEASTLTNQGEHNSTSTLILGSSFTFNFLSTTWLVKFLLHNSDISLNKTSYGRVNLFEVLRHEEFTEGCDAQCNGPYDNRWSKTMIGYGDEDTHFVLELTYNYGISSYELGNDYLGITIRSDKAIENAKKYGWPICQEDGLSVVQAPDGYKFYLINQPQPTDKDPVEKLSLACSCLKTSIKYWNETLGLKVINQTEKSVTLSFNEDQTKLQLNNIGEAIDRGTAYGRTAFSVPTEELTIIDSIIQKTNNKILTPLVSLDTPGKATVTVIILADPDGHEICFVGDEAFRELSKTDPTAETLLDTYIKKDEHRKNAES